MLKKLTPLFVSTILLSSILGCTFSSELLTISPGNTTTATPLQDTSQQTDAANTAAQPHINPEWILNGSLTTLYELVNPGVVTIKVFVEDPAAGLTGIPLGQGSGFLIDLEGHIITNQHVIEGAHEIEVDFSSGLKVWAEVVGTDLDSDLAVLHVNVDSELLSPLPLGDSDDVRVGQPVIAIGNPFGLDGSMTLGIISAIGRTLDSQHSAPSGSAFTAGDIIQTDAAINPGNSGGPLLNLAGEVIGVNRAIATDSFSLSGSAVNSGVGFAIPINILKQTLPSLLEEGSYDYPYLGISSLSSQFWNLKIMESLGFPSDTMGAYVTCVTPNGPAAEAGLIGAGNCSAIDLLPGGDLITAIDGQSVREFNDLLSYLVLETTVGQTVMITVLRDGKEVDVPVTIGARP